MENRLLGRSCLPVTPVGLGMAALGRPGYINLGHSRDLKGNYAVAAMRDHAHTVLDAAWDAGTRYFDAARSYGRAEDFLASWLKSRGRSPAEMTVGSKWGYTYTADWQVNADVHEVKQHTLDVLRRQRRESEENLGDYLDLYQIHSASLESGVLDNQAVLAELARFRDQYGLAIGLSLSGPGQGDTLWRALEIIVNGRPLFSAVQATWNLLERSAGPALQAAHEAGMGVIIKEALANGRLTSKNDRPDFAAQRQQLEHVAASHHTTIDALALAAVLAQPWVDVVLSGASTVEHLRSNVTALDVVWDSAADEQLASLVEPSTDYWATRSQLDWN